MRSAVCFLVGLLIGFSFAVNVLGWTIEDALRVLIGRVHVEMSTTTAKGTGPGSSVFLQRVRVGPGAAALTRSGRGVA